MLKVVIPMAGEGKRFLERGYTFPKPLVEIAGRSMIEYVIKNLAPSCEHRFIFVCREDHLNQFALAEVLTLLAPGCKVVSTRTGTAGALCSVLLAAEHIAGDGDLLVANADQWLDVPIDPFLAAAREEGVDGCVMTFPSTHPKWSYVKLEGGLVVAAAEKRPISRNATAGLYYFHNCAEFLTAAERMILKNASLGGEFFVCPVYNELILMGKRVTTYPISRQEMISLGTPEDVDVFASSKAKQIEF